MGEVQWIKLYIDMFDILTMFLRRKNMMLSRKQKSFVPTMQCGIGIAYLIGKRRQIYGLREWMIKTNRRIRKMTKEKQIDEIAKLICTYPQCIHYNVIGECATTECQTVDIAENLYKQGYRKTSDIAREIFAEIEYLIWQHDTHPAGELTEKIAELKKKYESEGGE